MKSKNTLKFTVGSLLSALAIAAGPGFSTSFEPLLRAFEAGEQAQEAPAQAQAQENVVFICERDQRPVDGAYEALYLVEKTVNNAKEYDAKWKSVGFNPRENKEVTSVNTLARGLWCRFSANDARLFQCRVDSLVPEEGSSGVST